MSSVLLSAVELYHTEFLYLKDLSVTDPYMILPAIVVGLMVLQQQFVPTGNMDPAQAKMMKFMPLMFGFFFIIWTKGHPSRKFYRKASPSLIEKEIFHSKFGKLKIIDSKGGEFTFGK